ncbi:class I SAM-dependent methyltransferase [Capilliphycus salinus ALCB114379]|uniref:class I SAM-dependent methyltransferase n=1 Tax=Capilliphycus salinus TaxID=2768948 RepID=UPI0039A55B93
MKYNDTALVIDDFHQRKVFGNLESNLDFLEKANLLKPTDAILEIGSGNGNLLNNLYRQGYNIRGVEINPVRIEESQTLYGNLPLSKVHSEALPFANDSFDVVMSFDVFEHIPNSDLHLQEVHRVLKPEGLYIVQTPNKLTNSVFETIRWKSFTKWQADHCSLHTYWGMIKRLTKNGFDSIEFYDVPTVTDFFKVKVKTYLGGFGLASLKVVNPDRFPLYLRTNFYLTAKKYTSVGEGNRQDSNS